MELNATTHKACKIVIALKSGDRLSAQRITEKTGYSKKSLEDALALLIRVGIVYSKKGCKGGYILVQKNITLLNIIGATEGLHFTCRLLNDAIRAVFMRYGPEDVV